MSLNLHAWSSGSPRCTPQVFYIFSNFFFMFLFNFVLYIKIFFSFHLVGHKCIMSCFCPQMLCFCAAHEYRYAFCCFILSLLLFSSSISLFLFVLLLCFSCFSNDISSSFSIGSFGVHLVIVICCVVVLFSRVDWIIETELKSFFWVTWKKPTDLSSSLFFWISRLRRT